MRRNARRWREHSRVPVWAVVKANGYGWGARSLIRLLEDEVEGFFVADADEARAARAVTARPIALLAASGPEETIELLDAHMVPNVASLEALAAADRWARAHGTRARIRVGIVPAAGWSGLLEDAVESFAEAAGQAAVDVVLWTHLTAADLWSAQQERFDAARARFTAAGASIVGTDVAGSFVSAHEGRSVDRLVRIGIGLFCASGARAEDLKLECAIRISAPVTAVLRSDAVRSAGYRGEERIALPWLAVVRCGYSDGLPARLAGTNNIVSIGMQYAVLA
ncbi:MAG: alanine racemase, partial [Polyangiaceae bacterium]